MSSGGGGMSFRRYMAHRPTRVASAAGAFTEAYRSDPDAPNARSWAELLDYLRQCDATDEVLHAARTCWDCYVRFRHRVTAARV
jgi:hypothetical protein